jgi:hypothetical protein
MSFLAIKGWRFTCICLALVFLLLAGKPAVGAENLRQEIAALAKDIANVMKSRKQDAIAVGEFSGPAKIPTSAGPAIQQCLVDELKKVGVTVNSKANLEVKGDYRDGVDKETKLTVIKLQARVLDENGDMVIELARAVFGNAELASLMGATTSLHPKKDMEYRNKELSQSLKKPSVFIQGSKVTSSKGSPYAVELLTGKGKLWTPRPAKELEGLAYVPIRRNELYKIRLTNKSPYDAVARVAIDGIDVFSFSGLRNKNGQPRYRFYLVPAGKTALIHGWHRTNERSDSFLVTEYAKSAAASVRSRAKIGTISVSFAAAWSDNKDKPMDEESGDRSGDATGFGPPVPTALKEVSRKIGVIRDTVSIRYTK